MAIAVTSSARDTETNDNLLTAGENGLNIMRRIVHTFKTKIIHVLLQLWLSYFICDNKHTFGKQMPPDLAVLPALSIETID